MPTSTNFSHCADEQHRMEGSRPFTMQAPVLHSKSYASRAMYRHESNTDNSEVAVGSRCCNT